MKKKVKDRNMMALELWSGKYGMRVIKAKKGKGTYSRKVKNKAAEKQLYYYVPIVNVLRVS